MAILLFLGSFAAEAQPPGQIVRGQVLDESSHYPVPGASIVFAGHRGAITDSAGRFFLPEVPFGNQTFVVTSQGYEPRVMANVAVTAGKEVVLTVLLAERVHLLDAVSVKSSRKRSLNNALVAVSGTVFNPDDTRRFAGAVGDPSRMITGFAGVVNADDSRNDIVVRGNSPTGLLWQLEGMDIPNPNHFGSLNSTGGPVSILNPNNLDKSDFITGAFPAQYGNAIASVFDLRLRDGNTERAEYVGEISFTGFELGAEGPIRPGSGASYIVNYRYSTVGILNKIGFNVGTGTGTPLYQDLNFRVTIPLNAKNKLAVFGLGGPSHINFYGNDADTGKNNNLYGNENENLLTKYFTGIAGATLETHFDRKTWGRLTLGISRTTEQVSIDSISVSTRQAFRAFDNENLDTRVSAAYYLTRKFSAADNLVAGFNTTLFFTNLSQVRTYGTSIAVDQIDSRNRLWLAQAYVQWKHRFSENLSATAGIHVQRLGLNGSSALEPRGALQYRLSPKSTLSFGVGWHSQMQSPLVYFYRGLDANGDYTDGNANLGFTRSRHFVLGYTLAPISGLQLKAELYHQAISRVPVDAQPSGFSMLNEGADFATPDKSDLVNAGTGRNYGVELTVDRSFSRGYYLLLTGSLFRSTYTGSDGVRHHTAFDLKHVLNVLGGKEFALPRVAGLFSVNLRLSMLGGKYTSPVDTAASEANLFTQYDETKAPYSLRQPGYFRADFKIGYKRNYRKSTLEAGIDFRNATNHRNIFIQTWNRRTQSIVNQDQQGFLPVPYFRFTF